MQTLVGSWGDQNDGTYRNPILNADYPDVDVERLGETFYMITSTIHYAPGMMVLESGDLVSWRAISHVFRSLDWEPSYNWDRMAGYSHGVWAGDLAHNEGTWYCYFIDWASGLYMSRAADIHGPWSSPICMMKRTQWTDPAVCWDREQRNAYLVCNFGKDATEPDKGNQIRMFRMSWDGARLLDEGTVIYHGPGAEAAKIYRIDGAWYIFLAEWRDNDRKQVVLRGPGPFGPFERRVAMERAPGMDRSCSQGALIQTADGSWWLTHQLVQHRENGPDGAPGPSTELSYEGRSQWLVPVSWKDGWPIPGEDRGRRGVGYTVLRHTKPIAGSPIAAPATDDDFDAAALGPQWEWNHNPRDDRWSLTERPGWLRLKACVPVNDGGFWNACNTVSQRLMGKGRGVATAKIDVSGMKPGQQAGFCHHSGRYVLAGVRAGGDGALRLAFNDNGRESAGPRVAAPTLYLRTEIDGNTARFAYGLDGDTWTALGDAFALTFGRWRGDRLGFYCWNDGHEAGQIDIDWFRYDYDGPRAG